MKAWMTKALQLLKASLEPPKHELNELDWKAVAVDELFRARSAMSLEAANPEKQK